MRSVTIYTDGACSGNPGPGGWGAILMYKDTKKTDREGQFFLCYREFINLEQFVLV